jgi:hypothetical protein
MAQKPFLLLGTPNSGTDWLAGCIARVTGWRYFQKEFFNPLTNAACAETLLTEFGCELVTGLGNLATCYTQQIDAVIEKTWPRDFYDFNKEVWSFAKLPALVAHFDCLVLTRSTSSLFPPSRLRVWQWYDAIWNSLHAAGRIELNATTPIARAREAHAAANDILLRDAAALRVPQLSYDHLISSTPEEVRRCCTWLATIWPLDAEKLAVEIITTRRKKNVPPA